MLLLTLFLGLQYNWLRRAGEAERERMQRRVEADTKNFADDLNREIQAAYFNFQVGAETWKSRNFAEFNERYDYWKSKTQYPELIRGFIFVAKGVGPIERYDSAARSFTLSSLPPDLEALRARLDDTSFSFVDEATALLMPIHEHEKEIGRIIMRRSVPGTPPADLNLRREPLDLPERYGTLLILLDRGVITNRILPDLTAKHFPEGNFQIAVTAADGSPVYAPSGKAASSDARAGLMSLSPDRMFLFDVGGPMMPRSPGEKRESVIVNRHVETSTFSNSETDPVERKTDLRAVEVKPGLETDGTRTRTSIFAGSDPVNDPWRLSVRHAAGSIGAFQDGEFRRSFLIGLGLYALLVGAIVAILISAMRSKRFAQRQIDFVSSVSHEFRTPLAVIYSAGENLADGVADDPGHVSRYGSLIKSEGRKLSAMVEQILQFAGARSGKRQYNFATTNAAAIVEAAVEECRPLLDDGGFRLDTSIDPRLMSIEADADALSSALKNLIANSIKYGNGSRQIRIVVANSGGKIKFSVGDDGLGIAAADLKQIFEPFYRAQNVVDAQIHGNGLGLALVKEIAEAHGGNVSAASEVGKGSTFTIELPVK